jgi:hypothetical protein
MELAHVTVVMSEESQKKGDFWPNATFKIAVEVEPVPVAVAQSSPSLRDGFLGMTARAPSRSDGILWQIRIS